jgi:hypothetical protein
VITDSVLGVRRAPSVQLVATVEPSPRSSSQSQKQRESRNIPELRVFKGSKAIPRPDADYWISVIVAHIGARLIEVTSPQLDSALDLRRIQNPMTPQITREVWENT